MSSVNKRCAAPAAHRAPRKRPSHRRSRWPGARVFWAFQRGADFSASPTYLEFSAPHRFTFPACPDFSVSPACPEFSVSPARSKSSAPPRFVFPACLEFSVFPDYLESSSPHRAPRKHPFRRRSRWPGARVFWAFQRSAGFSVFPPCPESSALPAPPEFPAFPAPPDFSALAAPLAPDASGALLRRAIACGEHSGRDQPFGAHAS